MNERERRRQARWDLEAKRDREELDRQVAAARAELAATRKEAHNESSREYMRRRRAAMRAGTYRRLR